MDKRGLPSSLARPYRGSAAPTSSARRVSTSHAQPIAAPPRGLRSVDREDASLIGKIAPSQYCVPMTPVNSVLPATMWGGTHDAKKARTQLTTIALTLFCEGVVPAVAAMRSIHHTFTHSCAVVFSTSMMRKGSTCFPKVVHQHAIEELKRRV
jgi:hypothetical protein